MQDSTLLSDGIEYVLVNGHVAYQKDHVLPENYGEVLLKNNSLQ